jgi:molybdopterin synthase sulfur carrier subunit
MEVRVKLFATLRENRFVEETRQYPPAATVSDAIADVGIREKVAIIFVNGRHAPPDQELREGDMLALFPAIGGG